MIKKHSIHVALTKYMRPAACSSFLQNLLWKIVLWQRKNFWVVIQGNNVLKMLCKIRIFMQFTV